MTALAPAPAAAYSPAGLWASLRALRPTPGDDRNLALDGLRGVAVLLVVGSHTTATAVPLGGVVGVTTFFVLSGYLITSLLLAEVDGRGTIAFGAFYVRRALRLVPALVAVLALTPVLLWLLDDPHLGPGLVPASLVALLYLSDFFRAAGDELVVYGHTWSLAVEEQFYLLWPALLGLVLLRRLPRRRVLQVVLATASVLVAWRLVAAATLEPERVWFAVDTNAFGLVLGAALAFVPARLPARAARWATGVGVGGLLGVSVLPVVPQSAAYLAAVGYGAPLAALLALVAVAGARQVTWGLSTPWLVACGRISYALYLWHEVLLVSTPSGEPVVGLWRLVAVAAAFALAVASWALVEAPALRLKRRFERAHL
ncbi:acyltransferase family protein [Nocardioides marmoraquaticus]